MKIAFHSEDLGDIEADASIENGGSLFVADVRKDGKVIGGIERLSEADLRKVRERALERMAREE